MREISSVWSYTYIVIYPYTHNLSLIVLTPLSWCSRFFSRSPSLKFHVFLQLINTLEYYHPDSTLSWNLLMISYFSNDIGGFKLWTSCLQENWAINYNRLGQSASSENVNNRCAPKICMGERTKVRQSQK